MITLEYVFSIYLNLYSKVCVCTYTHTHTHTPPDSEDGKQFFNSLFSTLAKVGYVTNSKKETKLISLSNL